VTENGARATSIEAQEDWLTPGRFALILGALIFVAFPQVALGWETFILRDFGVFSYPLAHFQRACFWRGELPFWNPYNNCGVPFLAQWNTMPLYPPALLYLLAPLRWSLGFFCLLHLWFAGLGMYFLARRWTGGGLAAAAAGLVFAFNGLSLNLLMWPSHIATLSWMPWVVLAVERAWQEGGRKVILAAMAGAMQMLAGGPETILLTWLFALALLLSEEIAGGGRPKAQRFSMAGRFGLVVALVAALAAAQLLPFLDLAAHSQRDQGYADTRWSLPGRGWANFLVPMVFGSTWNQDVFYQYGQYWTSSYYFGVGALLLAMLAVWTARERRVWLLVAAAAAAFILSLGGQTFVYRAFRAVLPQLTLMTYPIKFVTVIVFAGALLAGFALAALRRGRNAASGKSWSMEKRILVLGGLLLALIAGILLWAGIVPGPHDDFSAAFRNGLSRAGFVVAVIAVLFLQLARGKRGALRHEQVLSLLLLLVMWLDVWTHEPSQNPTAPPAVYTPGMARAEHGMKPQPALGASRVMVSAAADNIFNGLRVKDIAGAYLARRLGYFSNCNLLDDVPKVNGFFSLYPREQAALVYWLYFSTNASFPRLEDFLSVSQITSAGECTRFEPRATFLPEVTAGQRPVFLDETNTMQRLFRPDFDGGKEVFLPLETSLLVSATNQTDARVLSYQFGLRRVEAQVEAPAPSLVVISQTYYHWWHAYVDGKPTPLLRANSAFQAVQVPAGAHHLKVVYEDRAFQIGAAISILALLGCAGGWVWLKTS
jgi:hypothetical protein